MLAQQQQQQQQQQRRRPAPADSVARPTDPHTARKHAGQPRWARQAGRRGPPLRPPHRWRMNTGLPRHLTVTVWPAWMFDRSTSRLAMASTSCRAGDGWAGDVEQATLSRRRAKGGSRVSPAAAAARASARPAAAGRQAARPRQGRAPRPTSQLTERREPPRASTRPPTLVAVMDSRNLSTARRTAAAPMKRPPVSTK